MNTKKTRIFHPALFALYPVLFLFAHNIKEVTITQVIFPLVLAVIFAGALYGVLFLLVRDKIKAAVISTLFIFLFFSYGHIFDQIKLLGHIFNLDIPRHFYLLALFFIVWGVLFFLVKRTKKDLKTITMFLNVIGLVLVFFNVFNITMYQIKRAQLPKTVKTNSFNSEGITGDSLNKAQLPDIYYIILDEYASLQTIHSLYNYDPSEFAREIREMGFYIAEDSKTRYKMTEQSLASSLNMSYLKAGDDYYAMIRDNTVVDVLKSAGYKIVIFPVKEEAVFLKSDVVFDFAQEKKSTWINDFYMTLFKTTMLRILYELYINETYYSYYYRAKTLYIFDQLESLPNLQGPKFVYAHIVCPHWPFVFDRDGGIVNPEHFSDIKNKKYYLDQYIYINKKVKRVLEAIIKKSSIPPVIIVQSDHGPRGFGPGGGYYQLDVGDEWKRIFNSYYLPGEKNIGLYPSISPFNTFRLIFNLYLGTNYSILKE